MPTNYLLKRLPTNLFFVLITCSMGLVTSLTCLVNGYSWLVTMRVFLGVAEAGSMSGCLFLLSQFFRPDEMASKIAITTSSASFANIAGALIAYGLLHMGGEAGLHGWQW